MKHSLQAGDNIAAGEFCAANFESTISRTYQCSVSFSDRPLQSFSADDYQSTPFEHKKLDVELQNVYSRTFSSCSYCRNLQRSVRIIVVIP